MGSGEVSGSTINAGARKPLIGLGAGGHAKVVIEILRLIGGYHLVGLLDCNQELWGSKMLDVPVLGGDALLPELYAQGVRHAFIGLGTVENSSRRKELYEKARKENFEIASAIHPQAAVASSVRTGRGVTIMAGAIVNAAAQLGENVIINSGAIVEHDCWIGDCVHIATGARLAGAVRVEEGAHIGLGACIRQCIRIGRNSVVGAGAVVVKDVPDEMVVVGVPAHILRKVDR